LSAIRGGRITELYEKRIVRKERDCGVIGDVLRFGQQFVQILRSQQIPLFGIVRQAPGAIASPTRKIDN
jgi:hypothetical protein